jgi:hypothetical protein
MNVGTEIRNRDRGIELYEVWRGLRAGRVAASLTEEVIAEFHANPFGLRPAFHSPPLRSVLSFFRTTPIERRYFGVELARGTYGVLSSEPATVCRLLPEICVNTLEDLARVIFDLRVADLKAYVAGRARSHTDG